MVNTRGRKIRGNRGEENAIEETRSKRALRRRRLCLLPRLRVLLAHVIQQRAEALHHQEQI